MNTDWKLWGLMILAAVMELIGDLAFKWWAETDNRWWLPLGLAVYGGALVLFAILLKRAELAVIFGLWVGVATVLLAVIGWLVFGESLSLRRMAGLVLVIGGMFLLQE